MIFNIIYSLQSSQVIRKLVEQTIEHIEYEADIFIIYAQDYLHSYWAFVCIQLRFSCPKHETCIVQHNDNSTHKYHFTFVHVPDIFFTGMWE